MRFNACSTFTVGMQLSDSYPSMGCRGLRGSIFVNFSSQALFYFGSFPLAQFCLCRVVGMFPTLHAHSPVLTLTAYSDPSWIIPLGPCVCVAPREILDAGGFLCQVVSGF